MRLIAAIILLCVATLTGFGLVMSYSLQGVGGCSAGRQLAGAGLGTAALLLVARCDYRTWRRFATPSLWGVLLLFGFAVVAWVVNGPYDDVDERLVFDVLRAVLPAAAKIVLILFLAHFIAGWNRRLILFTPHRGLLPILATGFLMGVSLVLGAVNEFIVLGLVGLVMMLFGGVPPSRVTLAYGIGLIALVCLLQDHARPSHIMTWGFPVRPPIAQPQDVLANCGWFGVGLGNSRLRQEFPIHASRDYMGIVIGDELGWIALAVVLVAFLALIGTGLWAARRGPDRFGRLLSLGIASLFAFQLLLFLVRVTGLLPIRIGVLPFLSHGGLDLFVMLACVGVLLSICITAERGTNNGWPRVPAGHFWS